MVVAVEVLRQSSEARLVQLVPVAQELQDKGMPADRDSQEVHIFQVVAGVLVQLEETPRVPQQAQVV